MAKKIVSSEIYDNTLSQINIHSENIKEQKISLKDLKQNELIPLKTYITILEQAKKNILNENEGKPLSEIQDTISFDKDSLNGEHAAFFGKYL